MADEPRDTDPFDTDEVERRFEQFVSELRRHRGWFWFAGAMFIFLGTLAIGLPHLATLGANVLIGALFLAAGATEVARALRLRGTIGILGHVLFGLLGVGAGALILAFPERGMVALTAILAALFIAGGGLKIIGALEIRPHKGWTWMLASGVLSLVVGGVIWLGLPGTALWAIGLLVGIEFVFFGWALLVTAIAAGRD